MMACRPTAGFEQKSTRPWALPAICWKISIALERREGGEHLGVVAVDVDPLPDLAHLAGAVDEEGRALDAHRLLAVEVLLAPGAIGLGDLVVGIGEQREVEAELVAEHAVAGDVVGRDAEHGGAVGGQLGPAVAEGASLAGASRGVVFRVEVQHNRLAAQGREPDFLAVVGTQGEVGCALTLFDPFGLLGHRGSLRGPRRELRACIRGGAVEAGCRRAGVAALEPARTGEAFVRWLARGDLAGMSYLERRLEARLRPAEVVAGGRGGLCG